MTTNSSSPEPASRETGQRGFFAARKRVFISIAAVGLMALFAMWWLLTDHTNTEPSHGGHPLSHWVEQIQPDPSAGAYMPFRFTAESEAAIRAIGTNAVPTLLRWIKRPEQGLNARITNWVEDDRIPFFARLRLSSLIRQTYRPDQATLVFRVLKQDAKDAVPSLTQLLHSPQNSHWAVLALCAVGTNGVTGLQQECPAIFDGVHRANIIHPLEHGATPELEPQLAPFLAKIMSEDSHAAARMAAAQLLGKLTNSAAIVVPALTQALAHQDGGVRFTAAGSLEQFGAAAVSAIPSLQVALNDGSPQVRTSAAQALRIIQQATGVGADSQP
jgi:hypothetical protein